MCMCGWGHNMLYRHGVCASAWACAGQRHSDRTHPDHTKSPCHCSVEPALVAAEQWDQPFTSEAARLMNPAPR
jgi:hypothetical protein